MRDTLLVRHFSEILLREALATFWDALLGHSLKTLLLDSSAPLSRGTVQNELEDTLSNLRTTIFLDTAAAILLKHSVVLSYLSYLLRHSFSPATDIHRTPRPPAAQKNIPHHVRRHLYDVLGLPPCYLDYPLVIWHSYWKWPFIMDSPIKNGEFP